MEEELQGKFRTREELGEDGWQFVENQGETTLIFKKDKKFITWNLVNELIEDEWEYEVV